MANDIKGIKRTSTGEIFNFSNDQLQSTIDEVNSQISTATDAAISAAKSVLDAENVVTRTQKLLAGNYLKPFDPSVLYNKYDLVYYADVNGVEHIYRALEVHNPGEVWTYDNWLETSISQEIIGIRYGESEEVSLKVTKNGGSTEGLDGLLVTVLRSDDITEQYNLDSSGQCTFSIPKLLDYTISIKNLKGYQQIPSATYRAVSNYRSVDLVFYEKSTIYERVVINATFIGVNGRPTTSIEIPDDKLVTISIPSLDINRSGSFIDGVCQFDIPELVVGTEYTVSIPKLDEYYSMSYSFTRVASTPEFNYYTIYRVLTSGVLAMKDDSSTATIEELQSMTQDERYEYKYVLFSSSNTKPFFIPKSPRSTELYVRTSDISDDWTYKINTSIIPASNQKWISPTLDISELGHITNAASDLKGASNTDIILGTILNTNNAGGTQHTAPAASHCRKYKIVINGIDCIGYLPAIGQLVIIDNNIGALSNISSLIGGSYVDISAGIWWSSTQYYATNAWALNNGNPYTNTKVNACSVLPLFDL